jgi:hypothetical protein
LSQNRGKSAADELLAGAVFPEGRILDLRRQIPMTELPSIADVQWAEFAGKLPMSVDDEAYPAERAGV